MIVALPGLLEHAARDAAPRALDADRRTLHVRCGHDIMRKLAIAGFAGDFLWFADPYVEGPVPRTDTWEGLVRIRARFIEERYGDAAAHAELHSSYADLERAREYDRVNIWLEPANGLSLTQQLTLQILADQGPMNAPRLFGWYTHHYEPLPFLGDSGYWHVLRGLADAPNPALVIDERSDLPRESNKHWDVTLLPFGEALLRNESSWLDANPVDRWVGGVHIASESGSNWHFDRDRDSVELRSNPRSDPIQPRSEARCSGTVPLLTAAPRSPVSPRPKNA